MPLSLFDLQKEWHCFPHRWSWPFLANGSSACGVTHIRLSRDGHVIVRCAVSKPRSPPKRGPLRAMRPYLWGRWSTVGSWVVENPINCCWGCCWHPLIYPIRVLLDRTTAFTNALGVSHHVPCYPSLSPCSAAFISVSCPNDLTEIHLCVCVSQSFAVI